MNKEKVMKQVEELLDCFQRENDILKKENNDLKSNLRLKGQSNVNLINKYATLIKPKKILADSFLFGKKYKIVDTSFRREDLYIHLINEFGIVKKYSVTGINDYFKIVDNVNFNQISDSQIKNIVESSLEIIGSYLKDKRSGEDTDKVEITSRFEHISKYIITKIKSK